MSEADSPLMACILCRNLPCAGPCPCPVDGVDITHHVSVGYCPHPDGPREPYAAAAKPVGWDAAPKAEEMAKERAEQMARDAAERARVGIEVAGRVLWEQLHRFCLTRPSGCALVNFLSDFEQRISCGDCRAGYRTFIESNHVDAADPFAWSVRLHNFVNRKLGKPEMELNQARDQWLVEPGAMQCPQPGGK